MADFDYDEFVQGFGEGGSASAALGMKARRWVNIAGAGCSVALVLGLALWGYRLAVRDVNGVPVMKAMAGPMRIAPDDPGGEQALNQGLTVNAIAAMGTSSPVANQVTLAPAATALSPDDVPQVTPAVATTGSDKSAALTVTGTTGQVDPATTDALVASVSATQPAAIVVPGDPGALRVSLRPQPRPSAVKLSNVQTVAAAAPAKAKEIDPATIPVGTHLAQIGAFETPDLARAKFAELQGSFGDLMVGKDMVIQSAQSGGHTFYRLRAHGFESDEEARRFCAALQAEGPDCIPVTQRKP